MLRTMCFSKATQNSIGKRFKIIWRLLLYHEFAKSRAKSANVLACQRGLRVNVPINVPTCHTACQCFKLACQRVSRRAKFSNIPLTKWYGKFLYFIIKKNFHITLDIIVIHIMCIWCIIHKNCIWLYFYTSCHIMEKCVDLFFFLFSYFFVL